MEHNLLGTHPAWNEAIVISMTAFHGRGFFPEQFHPGDPQALAAAIEAFVGLLIEITLIATLTQRFPRMELVEAIPADVDVLVNFYYDRY